MARGKLIVVEGSDGTGKSTFTKALVCALQDAGIPAIAVREPGGSKHAEILRNTLLSEGMMDACGNTRMLCMFASRMQLCLDVIEPALAQGISVVCDRYCLSTFVYQVVLEKARSELFFNVLPYVTPVDYHIVLSAPFRVTLKRTQERDPTSRNGYDEIDLERKREIWEMYESFDSKFAWDLFGYDKSVKLDTHRNTLNALVEQTINYLQGKETDLTRR